MMNFGRLFKASSLLPKTVVWLWLAFGFIGFADASYLTFKHYEGGVLPCTIVHGCETVTNSQYATVGAIPVALFGAFYYLFIFLLGVFYFDRQEPAAARLFQFAAPFGLLASWWFLYLQIYVINALCLYCLVSIGTSTALFILSLFVWRKG